MFSNSTETIWLTKSKMFTVWPLKKYFTRPFNCNRSWFGNESTLLRCLLKFSAGIRSQRMKDQMKGCYSYQSFKILQGLKKFSVLSAKYVIHQHDHQMVTLVMLQ